MNEPKTIGEWLRGLRAQRKLTGARVARELGVSYRTLNSWEAETVVPLKISQVSALARWGNVEMSWLVGMIEAQS